MMRLPRPASPRALWGDIKTFAAGRSSHHWVALGLAIAIPAAIITTFAFDVADRSQPEAQIIYVESWRADRSEDEIRKSVEARTAQRKAAEEERRREFQGLQEKFGF